MSIKELNAQIFAESTENSGFNRIGRYRKAQEAYSEACADFIDKSNTARNVDLAVIEGSTGVGKSLGYLIPLLLHSAKTGKRVAIATHSRHLQKQLSKDIELALRHIQSITGKNLSYAFRFGSDEYAHYPSIASFLNEAIEKELHLEDLPNMELLCEWARISISPDDKQYDPAIHTGRISDFLEQENLSSLPMGLGNRDIAIRHDDSDADRYCHLHDIQKSKNADILIITQNMLMLHVRSGFQILDSERKIDSLVIDEADKLPEAAISVFQKSISINKSYNCFKTVSSSSDNFRDAFDKYIVLYDSLIELFSEVKVHPCALSKHADKKASLEKNISSLLLTLDSALRPYENQDNPSSEIRNLLSLKRELQHYLNICNYIDKDRTQALLPFVDWSNVYHYPRLKLVAMDASMLIANLYNQAEKMKLNRVIFTSATLANRYEHNLPDFSTFKHNIGLSVYKNSNRCPFKLLAEKSFKAEKYGKMAVYLAPNDLPSPFIKEDEGFIPNYDFVDYTITAIKYAAGIQRPLYYAESNDCGNRTLVLCGSFKEVNVLHEELKNENMPLIFHREGEPLRSYLKEFRENKNAILVTPSAWEGFDERVANVIISRFPNIPVNDEIEEKIGFITSKGVEEIIAANLIRRNLEFASIRKMTQGIGRLIRHERDSGRLFLLDPRIKKPNDIRWYQSPHSGKSNNIRYRDIRSCFKSQSQLEDFSKTNVLLQDGTVINKAGKVLDKMQDDSRKTLIA